MNAIERMLIEQTCQKLIFQYAMLNDQGDWNGLADMFTEGASFARPSAPDDIITGRMNILESFKSRKANFTQHIVSNVMVNVESPTSASAISTIQLFMGHREAEGQVATHALTAPFIGQFHDKLLLDEDRWLFSERRGILTIK